MKQPSIQPVRPPGIEKDLKDLLPRIGRDGEHSRAEQDGRAGPELPIEVDVKIVSGRRVPQVPPRQLPISRLTI